jgi:hypothetical protein
MLYKMTDTTDQYTRKLKYNAFMGTIAVCVIYAIVALAMILYINLTEQGKSLYSDLKPFALTFIFGTLFIIMVVTLMVVYWEPEQATKKEINDVLNNPLSCPDYYNLEYTNEDSNILFAFSSNINQIGNENPQATKLYIGEKDAQSGKFVNLYDYAITEDNKDYIKHKCKKDPSIIPDFATTDITTTRDEFWASGSSTDYDPNTPVASGGFNTNAELKDLKTLASFTTMYGGYTDVGASSYKIAPPSYDGTDRDGYLKLDSATNIKDALDADYKYKYDCSRVYPEYLARLDAKEYIDNNETGPKNLHRCGWAKACGVPWSSAGCS